MKGKRKIMLALLAVLGFCLIGCGQRQLENPYGKIVADLGDEAAYAFLVMDNDYNVLVTTDHPYEAGVERQAAMYCDVYYCYSGEATKLGSILSEGTAYPLSFSKDGIFAASAHSIEIYAVSDKDGLLHLKQGVYEEFDESGNAAYLTKDEKGKTASTEEEYQKLQDEYLASQTIHFSYGADGCVNEIH